MKRYDKPFSTPYYDELRLCGISLPCFLTHIRTDAARIEKPKDAKMFRMLFLSPRTDGCSGTIDTRSNTNLIMTTKLMDATLTYHPNPTKEDLLEFFGQRIAIRKMTPNEAGKLMGLDDCDLEKINSYPFTSYIERELALANADDKEQKRIKRESISKTAKYKCYGNSIVVQVLEAIFKNLFIPGQPENQTAPARQMTIFDIL